MFFIVFYSFLERGRIMSDRRFCSRCGEEYNATVFPNGHVCDERILKQIERDKEADLIVRKKEKEKK